MKLGLKIVGSILLLAVLLVGGAYGWASVQTNRILTARYEAHAVDFPIPFALTEAEVVELELETDPAGVESLARDRAIERGRHLVNARYACADCHGANFGGGVMVDAFPIGSLLGPNLTEGAGSRTLTYSAADWDRAVRHGILPDGRGSVMPAEDFRLMSDQELSDIVTYIRSFPPVDNTVPAPAFGPLGKILVATGQLPLSVSHIDSHHSPHLVIPPVAEATVAFGAHLAATCTGCHGGNLAGGPIAGGDPSWPAAKNLTPDPSALGSWTYEDFVTAFRGGARPDGTPLIAPMTFITPYAERMTDVEVEAIWLYLRSLPPVASGD